MIRIVFVLIMVIAISSSIIKCSKSKKSNNGKNKKGKTRRGEVLKITSPNALESKRPVAKKEESPKVEVEHKEVDPFEALKMKLRNQEKKVEEESLVGLDEENPLANLVFPEPKKPKDPKDIEDKKDSKLDNVAEKPDSAISGLTDSKIRTERTQSELVTLTSKTSAVLKKTQRTVDDTQCKTNETQNVTLTCSTTKLEPQGLAK